MAAATMTRREPRIATALWLLAVLLVLVAAVAVISIATTFTQLTTG